MSENAEVTTLFHFSLVEDHLAGIVVKAFASREGLNPGFESRLRRDFSGVE